MTRAGSLERRHGEAAMRWAEALARWAIPDEILAQAPESPWGFPPGLFAASARPQDPDSPSRLAGLAALPGGGEVLDVGCGGGAAALALVPPATRLTGVDSSAELLRLFVQEAEAAGVEVSTVLGRWPDVAPRTPVADVVVCHHVVYNVSDISPFLAELSAHARRRVVLELTDRHPLTRINPLWKRFWNLERPEGPTADDLLAVLAELGVTPVVERRSNPDRLGFDPFRRLEMTRRQLCLPTSKDPEIAEAAAGLPPHRLDLVTIWWDT